MVRLRRRLGSFSLRPLQAVKQRWRWVVPGVVLLLALAALLVYRARPARLTDVSRAATVEAQVYLQDTEVAARLAVLKTWVVDRRDLEELQPLYTAAADLLRTAHSALPAGSAAPTWTELEPTVTRLGVQLAGGGAEAVATIDGLLATLGAGP